MKCHSFLSSFSVGLTISLMAIFSGSALSMVANNQIELSGEFSVLGGEAHYSLPLFVAPGRAGHQPSLSLEYRSDSPDGLLGVGWSLGGVSSISRCGRNIRTDGRWSGVNFNGGDRYCLDGQRLVAVSGRDGDDLTEYRLETNGYAKVVSYGHAGNGPESFRVWNKDGSVHEYGVTEDARVELPNQTRVYKWSLSKILDSSKANTIAFTYDENNVQGTHKLAQVSYAGGSVKFLYIDSRYLGTKYITQYLGGSLLNITHRLRQIETYDSTAQKIGQYQLTYFRSYSTQRSILKSIEYCAATQCSSELNFDWSSAGKLTLGESVNSGFRNPRYLDINGDGIAEVYGEVSSNTKGMTVKDLQQNTYSGVKSFSLVDNIIGPALKVNQCQVNAAQSYIIGHGRLETYCQFGACSGNSCKYGSKGVNYGDFNGDGLETYQKGYAVIDINGDGQDDTHNFDVPNGGYRYQISDQVIAVPQSDALERGLTLPSHGGRVLKVFADINNDGYLDAVMGSASVTDYLYVHLFDGQDFLTPTRLNIRPKHTDEVFVADLNNDGYPEIGFGQAFYRNNGDNRFSRGAYLNVDAPIYGALDINGDGWVDILTRGNKSTDKVHVRYLTPYVQDKITQFNELGMRRTVSYQPASNSNVYTPSGTSKYPFRAVTPKKFLVHRVEKMPRGYERTSYTYHYEGAKTHLRGGGFLGFRSITEIERAEVMTITKTTYEQENIPAAGQPIQVDVSKNQVLIYQNTYQYRIHARSGYPQGGIRAKYYQVYPQQENKKTFRKTMLGERRILDKQVSIARVLDSDGNLLEEKSVISGGEDGGGQFTQRRRDIYYDATNCGLNSNLAIDWELTFAQMGTIARTVPSEDFWDAGAVKRSDVSITDNSNQQTKTNTNQYQYNDKGLLVSHTFSSSDYDMVSDTALKLITYRYGYDVWGNVVSQTEEGTDLPERTSTIQYDANGLYKTSTANALGHRVVTTYNAQGLLTRVTYPLKGRFNTYTYDVFGRELTQTSPGVKNTIQTRYAPYLHWSTCPNTRPTTVNCVTTTPAAGGKVITQFDYAGREVRKLHTSFNGRWVVVDTDWDRNGRKVRVTRPQFLKKNTPAPAVTFTYDSLDRELTKQEPGGDGGVATFTTRYEGYRTTVTDDRGFVHSTISNVMGHILRKSEPLGAYQTYQYYPDGKLKSSTDSAGNTTEIRYDNLGHRRYLNDPDMGKWTYTYNVAGELTYKRDAKGTVTAIEYDRLGRKVKQTEGGKVSTWRFDENGATGTLSGFSNLGNQTDYFYNQAGLREKVSVRTKGETFSTNYVYDDFERLSRELRPNGARNTLQTQRQGNEADRFALEYIYNPNGYLSAVRSPKNLADKAFTSVRFREEIKQLLDQAITQANDYLNKAERYYAQQNLINSKLDNYYSRMVDQYVVDRSSQVMLEKSGRYKQWCNEQNECYLRPAAWVILHGDVSTPFDITLGETAYRLTSTFSGYTSLSENSSPSFIKSYDAMLEAVSLSELSQQQLSPADDLLVVDPNDSGQNSLMSDKDIYVAHVDNETSTELLFTAQELSLASTIAATKYRFYIDLAEKLVELTEQVAKLGGMYCDFTNQLAGKQIDLSQRTRCQNNEQIGQADHLNLILTQSELEASQDNLAYIYYWQRRDTDAYDHTLSETLGNGLVNTYRYDANTGRPSDITTHKANLLFDHRINVSQSPGRNIRYLQYRYDNHNNVTYRYDEQLGITDTWQYDGLDRVVSNKIVLTNKMQHGVDNPDLKASATFEYDKLGNITFKTGVGRYKYDGSRVGPHAVTSANGLNYQYDANGNMLRAWVEESSVFERELEWTTFNKPSQIIRNGKTVNFSYDANYQRYLKTNSDGIETFYFGKVYEREIDTKTGVVQHKHFIYADGKLIALNTQVKEADDTLKDKQVRYLHYNALNSVDMITDGYGLVVERRSYDSWGKQRKVSWRETGSLDVVQKVITNRGYTGHEEIAEVGLIHMNGRVYDQELARFLSPDPIIQAPFITNSFNRYAYVMNNPLKYIDPTGYRWKEAEWDNWSPGPDICSPQTAGENNSGKGSDKDNGRGDDKDHRPSNPKPKPPENKPRPPVKPPQPKLTIVGVLRQIELQVFGPIQSWASSLEPEYEMSMRVAGSYYHTGTIEHVVDSLDADSAVAYSEAIKYGTAVAGVLAGLNKRTTVPKGTPPENLSPPGAGRTGAFKEAKRQSGIPASQQPSKVGPNIDKRGMVQPGKSYEFEVPAKGGGTKTVIIRDDSGGHDFGPGNPQNRGSHFNNEAGDHFDY